MGAMSGIAAERHVIIGTAGHIDHGKTALVKALTGIDADSLAEEKRRGITIELGFVFLESPEAAKQIVFIDVPGHEKLVKTMVAGASNIDAALLVVAADEGISVQTREHFDILSILGIDKGIIAITKSDLVDRNRIHELRSQLSAFVVGSFLEGAPVIPFSAVSGEGIEELKAALWEISRSVSERLDTGVFRMPVDRVFTMKGFGTVIAGTILSGSVKTGDKIEIFPEGITAKVRGVHVHHQKTDRSNTGKRTAVNLQNIEKDKLRRGQCAGRSGSLIPTIRLDGRLTLLKTSGREMKHRERIRLHTGTSEIICRVVLFDRDGLQPGDSALAQFVLESQAVAVAGDRFVIRTFSPLVTIGGGVIVDAAPSKHKRFDPQTLAGMERLEGSQENVVEQILLKAKYSPLNPDEIATRIGEDLSKVAKTLDSMEREQTLVAIRSGRELKYLHREFYEKLTDRFLSLLKDYLAARADRMDMPSVELRSAFLRLADPVTFNFIRDQLCEKEIICKKGSQIGLVGYLIDMTPCEQKLAGEVEKIFQTAGMESPLEATVRETLNLKPALFQKIMSSLIQAGKVLRLNEKVTYHVDALQAAEDFVKAFLKKNPCVTIIDVRNELQLSRKYGQAILEYFDKIGLTKRVGDDHVPV